MDLWGKGCLVMVLWWWLLGWIFVGCLSICCMRWCGLGRWWCLIVWVLLMVIWWRLGCIIILSLIFWSWCFGVLRSLLVMCEWKWRILSVMICFGLCIWVVWWFWIRLRISWSWSWRSCVLVGRFWWIMVIWWVCVCFLCWIGFVNVLWKRKWWWLVKVRSLGCLLELGLVLLWSVLCLSFCFWFLKFYLIGCEDFLVVWFFCDDFVCRI